MKKSLFAGVLLVLAVLAFLFLRPARPVAEADKLAAPSQTVNSADSAKPMELNLLPTAPKIEKKHAKAFLTAEEKVDQHKWLSNPENVRTAVDTLEEKETAFNDKVEDKRMDSVTYLVAAVSWGANPQREQILQSMRDVIEHDNLSGVEDQHQRNSVAMDKIELFQTLLREDPASAETLQARAQGTWLAPILKFSHARFDQFLAKTEAK